MAMWAGVQGQMWADEDRRVEEARKRGGDAASKTEMALIRHEQQTMRKQMAEHALKGSSIGSAIPGVGHGLGALAGLAYCALFAKK